MAVDSTNPLYHYQHPTTTIDLGVLDDNLVVYNVSSNTTRPVKGKYRCGGLLYDDEFGLLIMRHTKSIIRPRQYYASS